LSGFETKVTDTAGFEGARGLVVVEFHVDLAREMLFLSPSKRVEGETNHPAASERPLLWSRGVVIHGGCWEPFPRGPVYWLSFSRWIILY